MLSSVTRVGLVRASAFAGRHHLSTSTVAAQKASDPIQQLFVDKVREYAQKSKAAGGKMVDAPPQVEAAMKKELERVAVAYGGSAGEDMTKFPSFTYTDPKIDDINL